MLTLPRYFCSLGLLALAACFESDQERAEKAYDAHDFATADRLSRSIAEGGNPRGYQLLALMAAQGLGRDVDFAAAVALADEAAALEPSYSDIRAVIEERIEATAAEALAAYESEKYARAFALSEPLAAYGHEAGAALRETLITDHYVALPGSDLSWRAFWNQCSGNTRYDSTTSSQEAFEALCANRRAVWDGTVIRASTSEIRIKMKPGRPGARQDLTLVLAAPADPALAVPGRKVRYSGVIAERGTAARPDILIDGHLIGLAPLTAAELSRDDVLEVRAVMAACQALAEANFRAAYMPDWAIEVERLVRAGGSPQSRAFSLFVGVVSEADAFKRLPEGGWRGVFEGTVTIQSVVARTAQVTNFTADCVLDGAYERGVAPEGHGAFHFLSVSEPKVDSAPGRLRTP